MIYLYNSSLLVLERIRFHKHHGPTCPYNSREIVQDPSWPKCKIYQMANMPLEYFTNIQFAEGYENEKFPDFFAWDINIIVSENMRKAISDIDDFEHQYHPATLLDYKGNEIFEGQYDYLFIRRVLEIERTEVDLNYGRSINPSIITIQNHRVLREEVETLPIWQIRGDRYETYVNKKMLETVKSRNLSGFEWCKEY